MVGSADEFPLLSSLGLYAAEIRGDGNCLFNALSDQLYGHQDEHATIRARVIQHMRDNADHYKSFISVHPGGGTRRNPKRKTTAAAFSSSIDSSSPSAAEVERVFEAHLNTMAKGGTYGDNMEITAFSEAFGYDVKIYQMDFAYMISSDAGAEGRPVVHIAYHRWEHYSSIRNLDGPHSGVPLVRPKALSVEEEQQQKEKLAQACPVLPWQIEVVSKSLPFLADKPRIKRALEATRGNIDRAVSNLLDDENGSNNSSSRQDSSSIEREPDSDDDMSDLPTKRQNRRLSRTTQIGRAQRSVESRHALSQLAAHDGSQESFDSSWDSDASSIRQSSQDSSLTQPTSIENSDVTITGDTITVVHPTSASAKRAAGVVKHSSPLKLAGHKHHAARLSARDRKDMKKLAQKAARKERQQNLSLLPDTSSASTVGLALRANDLTQTPPLEILRTLHI